MDAIEELKKTRLMVLARGVPKDVLLKAVAAIEEAGVTVFESTFDHRRADCVAENAEKIAALVGAFGGRMAIGAGTVLTVEEVRAAHAAGASFIVSPDSDPDVIAETKRLGMAGRAETVQGLGPNDVLVVGYGLLANVSEELSQVKWAMAVFDEAQALKNPLTKRARAARDIKAGAQITRDDLTWKRPAHGISPRCYDEVLAMRARRDIPEDTVLTWADLA